MWFANHEAKKIKMPYRGKCGLVVAAVAVTTPAATAAADGPRDGRVAV